MRATRDTADFSQASTRFDAFPAKLLLSSDPTWINQLKWKKHSTKVIWDGIHTFWNHPIFLQRKIIKKQKKASISQKDIQVEGHLLEIQINSNGEHNCKLSKQPSLNLKFRWHHFHWTGKSSNGSMGEILGNCPPHDRPTRAISYNRLFRISSTILG